jgi:type IV pilus assembly protein PilE
LESQQVRGFTLIELMIVIVVIGLLAAIGIPNYQQYRIKANRAEAQAFLMDVAQRQQQFLIDSRAFGGTVADLNLTVPEGVGRNYTITLDVDAGPPPTFIVTAEPIANGMQDGDGDLTIDQAGTKEWDGNPW